MMEKHCRGSFFEDIDKILAGELDIPAEYKGSSEEDQELLYLAQVLARVEYAAPNSNGMERLRSQLNNNGRLEDDELDMVAGGLQLDALDERNKKNGL